MGSRFQVPGSRFTKNEEQSPFPKWAWWIALTVLVLDQFTKELIKGSMPVWSQVTVIEGFFNIVHVLNRGAAFGFLNTRTAAWLPLFFIVVTGLAVLVIVSLLRRARGKGPLYVFALSSILGGALGNMLDRLRHGVVVDFLDFHIGRFHWPAFNIADIAISFGAICLLITFYTRERHASDSH